MPSIPWKTLIMIYVALIVAAKLGYSPEAMAARI
jgi:hypothetical protein